MRLGLLTAPFPDTPLMAVADWAAAGAVADAPNSGCRPPPGASVRRVQLVGRGLGANDSDLPAFWNEISDHLEGFAWPNADTGKLVAKALGVEPCFVTPSWTEITAGNWSGRWDMSVGSMTITEDREEVIDFARKYDPQPFHLSDEAAAKTHFGRLAASGWHTCAMTMAVIESPGMPNTRAGIHAPASALLFAAPESITPST